MAIKKNSRRLKKKVAKKVVKTIATTLEHKENTALSLTQDIRENSVKKNQRNVLALVKSKVPSVPKIHVGKAVEKLELHEGGRGEKVIATLASLALLGGTIWLAAGVVPQWYKMTNIGGVEELDRQADQRKKEKEAEDARVNPASSAKLTTNFGDIVIKLFKGETPVSADNFLRLVDRKKYDDLPFHRMVEADSFAVLQGGDYGRGALNADGEPIASPGALTATIQDEVWKIFPEFDDAGNLINQPVFNVESAYAGYSVLGKSNDGVVQQQVTIKKGYIAMAKTQEPNSASSQFFLTLTDTTLPADYTVFGKVSDESLAVIDRIAQEVSPIDANGAAAQDGKPEKEVKIVTAIIQ